MTSTLREFLTTHYFAERDLRGSTQAFFRCKLNAYERWLGRPATLDDLNSTMLNAFLDYRISDRSRETARSEKAVLRAIWQAAFDARLMDNPPLRIKKIRRAVPEVDAWDCGQVNRLLKAATCQLGRFRGNRVPKSLYWLAVVRTLFDTGLRAGDLLALESSRIVGPGSYIIRQLKTGGNVPIAISEATWQAIERIIAPDRPLLFGDVLKSRAFFQGFARMAKAAGLDGRSKMLRRTSGSMIEREHPGEGHTHLGNGRGVFERHYLARRIAPITARFPVFSTPSDN
jgi:integrase